MEELLDFRVREETAEDDGGRGRCQCQREGAQQAKPLMRLGVGCGLGTPLQAQKIGEAGETEGHATLEAIGYTGMEGGRRVKGMTFRLR